MVPMDVICYIVDCRSRRGPRPDHPAGQPCSLSYSQYSQFADLILIYIRFNHLMHLPLFHPLLIK